MNDPISRDEAVAAVLGTAIEYQLIYGKKEPKEGFVRSLIKRIANISQEEPEWIPCSDRLPDKEGHYLCSFIEPKRIDRIYIDLAYWTGGRWYGYMADAINAWMPLPEPYKAERKDNV